MPNKIVNEKYNGANALTANAGDWVEGILNFSVRFSRGSGDSNKITWRQQGSNYWFESQNGDWGDEGFLAGDTITASYSFYAAPAALQNQSFTFTILYITGTSMYVDTTFGLNPSGGLPFTHIDGRQFPTESYVSGILITADKAPATVDFDFNLTPNGSSLINSMLDDSINKFRLDDVASLTVGGGAPMTQLANLSGGLIKDVSIGLIATPSGGWRDYEIRYKFLQWGLLQDGIEPPNYYDNIDCLAPICRVSCYAEYGNPNGILIDTSENIEANTGFFDENYNGVLSLYNSIETTWFDSFLNPIEKLNNSGFSSFTATINAPNQVDPTSTYRIGLVWRPQDGTYYQQKTSTNVGENLLLNAPEIDFIADGSTSPFTFQGLEDENGARWDFQNLKFEITGVNEITVSGDILPNSQATALFANVPDGGRKTTIWVSIGDFSLDGTSLSKRVSLRIFDEDNYDAPILGVQIPNIIDEVLLDHNGNGITSPKPQTTTEDDVLYISNFQLINGLPYEGIRANIQAFNTVTEESFTLEEIFFSFTSVPQIAGVFQPNFLTPRGFNLPPSSDRNHISLVRNPANDAGGLYGLTLEYGYLSRWEYWISQPNVDNDFFDITQPFDGKNNNWQRFSNSGDWIVRLAFFTRLNGVDDFNYQEIGIRPYEDDIDITTTWGIEVLSNGTTPTNLVNNELHEITSTLTWSINSYTNPWAEMTIEDFESGNRWVISSVLAQGGIAQNPLQPIAGQSLLDLQLPSANVAVLKAYVDTNVISSNKVCLTSRIYSKDTGVYEFLITDDKDSDLAFSVRRTTDLINYPQNLCMRVRRKSDNTEMDFGFVNNELDTAGILAFTGNTINDFGFVVTWYNQSAPIADDAIQVSMTGQPLIVDHGVINLATNGKPALSFDGVNQFFNFANLPITQSFCESFVFERLDTDGGGITNSLGTDTFANPYTFIWDFGNNMYSGMNDAVNGLHLANSTTIGSFQVLTRRQQANNDVSMYRNSVLMGVANYGLGTASQPLNTICLSRQLAGKLLNIGNVQEEVFYKKDKSAEQSFIETNTNNYYNNY